MKRQQIRKAARKTPQSLSALKANLKRLEALVNSPYVRPVDFTTRDRFARKLRDAKKIKNWKNLHQ